MSDEEYKLVLLTALKSLLTSSSLLSTPLTSLDLLARVMSIPIPSGLLPHSPPPRFKLTDLGKFERILEKLSETWEEGWVDFSTYSDDGGLGKEVKMVIYDLGLFERDSGKYRPKNPIPSSVSVLGIAIENTGATKKRKRVVDEDADSAAGDEEDEEVLLSGLGDGETNAPATNALGRGSTFANLSPEMREVYTFIQKGTAKGRLLAERVRSTDVILAQLNLTKLQFHSQSETFEPVCSYITKDECIKARKALVSELQIRSLPPNPICDGVHFRPLIRPYTDTSLGHCSYLNTCYSEPTYAQSPSIPPLPTSHGSAYAGMALPNSRGATSLPSGLGAGGRGKEKAPCRYLHYEVDWDPPISGPGALETEKRNREREEKDRGGRAHRLEIGMGPTGKGVKLVCTLCFHLFN